MQNTYSSGFARCCQLPLTSATARASMPSRATAARTFEHFMLALSAVVQQSDEEYLVKAVRALIYCSCADRLMRSQPDSAMPLSRTTCRADASHRSSRIKILDNSCTSSHRTWRDDFLRRGNKRSNLQTGNVAFHLGRAALSSLRCRFSTRLIPASNNNCFCWLFTAALTVPTSCSTSLQPTAVRVKGS